MSRAKSKKKPKSKAQSQPKKKWSRRRPQPSLAEKRRDFLNRKSQQSAASTASPASQAEAYKRTIAEAIADPVKFIHLCWPEMKLYPRQVEILRSLADNAQTYVHSANEMGKTRVEALATLWWFCSREPARVVITSSSENQLRSVLWNEIRHLVETSRVKLPLDVKDLKIEKRQPPGSATAYVPLNYVEGYVSRRVESFQGHHLPQDRPRVLCIFEEASGIADEFKDAADSWAHCQLIVGNPLNTTNWFYRGCKAGDMADPSGEHKLLRKVIHIDGLDSPNVKLGMMLAARGHKGPWPLMIPGLLSYPEFLRRSAEWDEVKKRTRLHGLFYEGEQTLLYPMAWLDRSEAAYRQLTAKKTKRIPKAIGLDVAMGGRDLTVWAIIDEFGLIELVVKDTPNTMEIPGITIKMMRDYKIPPCCVALDMGGGGKQIFDRLAELGHNVMGVHFGSSAGSDCDDPADKLTASQSYVNKRAEMYGMLRQQLDPNLTSREFTLPPEHFELRQELAVLPLQYDSEGRMYLPPKDKSSTSRGSTKSLREILGRSPDRADALVLALWAAHHGSARHYYTVGDKKTVDVIETRTTSLAKDIDRRVAEMMERLAKNG